MMILERTHDLITVLKPHFLPIRIPFTQSKLRKSINHTFDEFTVVITRA